MRLVWLLELVRRWRLLELALELWLRLGKLRLSKLRLSKLKLVLWGLSKDLRLWRLGKGLRLLRVSIDLRLRRWSYLGCLSCLSCLSETISLFANSVDGEILIVSKILKSLINLRGGSLVNKTINVLWLSCKLGLSIVLCKSWRKILVGIRDGGLHV